jgi:predicted NACHT family NTPase
MRVLDMSQPIELTGEGGVYTTLRVLEKQTRLRSREELQKTAQTSPGLDVVEQHPRLMVLGKPGSGKTTFLKYLAMQCITEKFAADKVPFFVSLKGYSEDIKTQNLVLVEYLAKEYLSNQSRSSGDQFSQISTIGTIKLLLRSGRGFVLLDGLDEVRKEHTSQIIREIRAAADHFGQSLFVVTCRIAAKEYTFERFTDVEIADFDEEQIATFVRNWFRVRDDLKKSEAFIQRLQQSEQIRELASNPLLLTLFCLVFGDSGDFPRRRADLYKEGVEIFLKKWDAKRDIQRDEFDKKLDLRQREDLLCSVAFQTFLREEKDIEQSKIELYISEFIQKLKDVDAHPDVLRMDSESVLKTIQSDHGLLVEKSRGYYSFSHLTLHEYFAAKEISSTSHSTTLKDIYDALKRNFSNPQWREVFLLTVELLKDASDLVLELKKDIDFQLAGDPELQGFLQWVQEKSSSISTPHQTSVVRAFYYGLSLNIEHDLGKIAQNFDHRTCLDFELDQALIDLLNAALAKAVVDLRAYLEPALRLAKSKNIELVNELQKLNERLPDVFRNSSEERKQWKKSNGEQWVIDLRNTMTKNRNIGQTLNFDPRQERLLKNHYKSNLFLVECLETSYYVDRETRELIEETFLLPFEETVEREIEKGFIA